MSLCVVVSRKVETKGVPPSMPAQQTYRRTSAKVAVQSHLVDLRTTTTLIPWKNCYRRTKTYARTDANTTKHALQLCGVCVLPPHLF